MKCLKRPDDENFRINLPKCHFGKLEINWLGYHISQSGILPLESKTSSILALEAPKTLKKLRSFLGTVHYIGKFISNLAQISHPLRPLLKKTSKFIWTAEHENFFNEIKNRIGVVWSIEYYKNYLYGKKISFVTDHRALLSIMKENGSNKSYNSRFTCLIDCLLPF